MYQWKSTKTIIFGKLKNPKNGKIHTRGSTDNPTKIKQLNQQIHIQNHIITQCI